MKLKHTPGPWEIDRFQNEPPYLIANKHDVICEFTNHPRIRNENRESNAKLIAAAPEMLELLLGSTKRIILEIGIHAMEMHGGVINYIDKNIHCSQMPGVKREWENLLKNVKLIEKATGQTIEEVIR